MQPTINPIDFIREAMSNASTRSKEYRWGDIEGALRQLTSSASTPEVEQILLEILRFDGQFHLSALSEVPHCMPPEEMLKSHSIQTLARWTGLTHLSEMQRVGENAASPVLSGIVRKVIKEAKQGKKPVAVLNGSVESTSE